MGGAGAHPSELLHLNQAGGTGIDRMVSLKGGLRRVVSLSGFGRVGAKPEFLNQMMCYIIKILNSSPVGSFSSETESIISPSYDISDIISQSLKEVVLIFNFFTLKAACV